MNKSILLGCAALFLASCSHHQTTAEAEKKIEDKYTPKIGVATKHEIMEEYGNPEWCKLEDSGAETCRFYLKKGVKWIGDDKRDKTDLIQFDQIIAHFDGDGILRSFKADAQR